MITLTENAQKKVHSILEGEGPDARLRMLVSGKGCAGLTYGFEITDEIMPRVLAVAEIVSILIDKYYHKD